jgi:hypothetical protein
VNFTASFHLPHRPKGTHNTHRQSAGHCLAEKGLGLKPTDCRMCQLNSSFTSIAICRPKLWQKRGLGHKPADCCAKSRQAAMLICHKLQAIALAEKGGLADKPADFTIQAARNTTGRQIRAQTQRTAMTARSKSMSSSWKVALFQGIATSAGCSNVSKKLASRSLGPDISKA